MQIEGALALRLQWKRRILAPEVSSPERWESTSGGEKGEGRALVSSLGFSLPCGPQLAPLDSLACSMKVSPVSFDECPVRDVIFRFAFSPKSRVASVPSSSSDLGNPTPDERSASNQANSLKESLGEISLHCAHFGPYLQQIYRVEIWYKKMTSWSIRKLCFCSMAICGCH